MHCTFTAQTLHRAVRALRMICTCIAPTLQVEVMCVCSARGLWPRRESLLAAGALDGAPGGCLVCLDGIDLAHDGDGDGDSDDDDDDDGGGDGDSDDDDSACGACGACGGGGGGSGGGGGGGGSGDGGVTSRDEGVRWRALHARPVYAVASSHARCACDHMCNMCVSCTA